MGRMDFGGSARSGQHFRFFPVISDFFGRGGYWPKMDVQLHLFLKTKFLFVLIITISIKL